MDKQVNIMEEELNLLLLVGLERRLNLLLLKELPLKLLKLKKLPTNSLQFSSEKVLIAMLSKYSNKLPPSLTMSNLPMSLMLMLELISKLQETLLFFSDNLIPLELTFKEN